jgi:hypothetical protein
MMPINQTETAQRELPRYKCHKEVHALKILKVEGPQDDGSYIITPADSAYESLRVPDIFVLKCKPEAGGYYVFYTDGYRSYSPAKAFEEGYTLVTK